MASLKRLLGGVVYFKQTVWSQNTTKAVTIFQPATCYSTRVHRGLQREKPRDLYAVLDVSPSATQQQVKDAFYKLSLKYHPDRNQGSLEAHQRFTDLTEAYSVLGQYELRKKYDKGLLHQYHGKPHTVHQ